MLLFKTPVIAGIGLRKGKSRDLDGSPTFELGKEGPRVDGIHTPTHTSRLPARDDAKREKIT